MTTTVFNLSAVDRIEADVQMLEAGQSEIEQSLASQAQALANLMKTLSDFISALGGGADQAAIDAATTALRQMEGDLRAAVERDKAS